MAGLFAAICWGGLTDLMPGNAAERVATRAVLHAGDPADAEQALLWAVDESQLKRHASFLASDTLEGRQAGTRGSQAAAAYLMSELKKYRWQPAGETGDYRQHFGAGYCNILAEWPGHHPQLTNEVIVVGAHYDHVGYGNPSNSYGPFGRIHNGADDNASGVSLLLELARTLSEGPAMSRTIVLAFWDAEEAGLLGSAHWVSQPTLGRRKVVLALNLDMVGRLRKDLVTTMGWRTAPGLRTLLSSANGVSALWFQFDQSLSNDSDHYSFYQAGIPVLHFDTGKHDDYHRPSDDVEHLNWKGLKRIGQCTTELVITAAHAPTLPVFRPESRNELSRKPDLTTRQAPPIRLGVTWKSDAARQGVVEVGEVIPGYPAAVAGLRTGDRLLRFGTWIAPESVQENGDGKTGTVAAVQGRRIFEEFRTAITVSSSPVEMIWVRAGNDEPMRRTVILRGEPIRSGCHLQSDPVLPDCVYVKNVIETSPADRAGLQPGDIVYHVESRRPGRPEELHHELFVRKSSIRLGIERQGRRFELLFPVLK